MTDPATLRLSDNEPGALGMNPGRVLDGKYRIEGVVGMGGMGVVVSAEHLQLQQKVAIKLISMNNLSEAQQADARRRFLREGQAAAKLSSDHVVRIFDVGTLENGAPFMVMELLRGEDMAAMLDRQGPPPVELAVSYLLQACDALMEAHAHGIVHRDLKPANLFVCKRPDSRVSIKVLDFGISKLITQGSESLEASLTSTRTVVGSPHYMSPEQVRNAKAVDARTDIWALGTVLYEMLVGRPAFDADTLPGICAAIAADTPPSIRSLRADVPEALEQIVVRCLEKDASKRFQSVAELVTALQPFAPASAARGSTDYAAAVRASAPSAEATARGRAETLSAEAPLEFSLASTNPPPPMPSGEANEHAPLSQSATMAVEALAPRRRARMDRRLALIGAAIGLALGIAALAKLDWLGTLPPASSTARSAANAPAAPPPHAPVVPQDVASKAPAPAASAAANVAAVETQAPEPVAPPVSAAAPTANVAPSAAAPTKTADKSADRARAARRKAARAAAAAAPPSAASDIRLER